MEQNLEEPLSRSELARGADLSTRQLERLFRKYLNRSPARYYLELRLNKARLLLLQTNMSVIDVALACGDGRAHVRTPVTNAQLVCRLLLEKKKPKQQYYNRHNIYSCYSRNM